MYQAKSRRPSAQFYGRSIKQFPLETSKTTQKESFEAFHVAKQYLNHTSSEFYENKSASDWKCILYPHNSS